MSWIVQMCGWLSAEAARASRSKRSSAGAIVGQLRRQELQRDVPAEPQVLGPVDDAHAAAAELFDDAVVRDRPADHEESTAKEYNVRRAVHHRQRGLPQ